MRSSDSTAPTRVHQVQLFDTSRSLAETVAEHLLAAFDRGETLLVVATPAHRELLTRRFAEARVNVAEAMLAGRMLLADAQQTVDQIVRHDTPSSVAFAEIVGGILARVSSDKPICIYGEMVDVLAARGQFKAAYQLEELWNTIPLGQPFSLFCGYASGHFGDPRTANILGAICRAHDHVHTKPADLLAGFLLNQPAVKRRRTAS